MRRLGLLMTVLVLGVTAAVEAAPVDRSTFVRRADAVCKTTIARAVPLVQEGVQAAGQGNTDAAAQKLVRAYRLFREAFHRIGKLNKPPQDGERIRKWIDLSLRATRVGVDSVQALRAEEIERARRLTDRTLRIIRKANDVVRFWGFQYCV
jgi:hypothetical protein